MLHCSTSRTDDGTKNILAADEFRLSLLLTLTTVTTADDAENERCCCEAFHFSPPRAHAASTRGSGGSRANGSS
jgi:hypothetical protein